LYLSRLELLGFKSFPFKTKIFFDQGITAIVGPNGCGKTNIVDATRWVLGEQRTSVLRGERMEEVIFHGTQELKPLGMAEVSLTFDNKGRILPIDYTEVSITRRLFKSGESEYYINKNPCRLKDIIDLFLDTGMGAHTYSVLQREMIDIIISDQAEERRFLFEEASGISKYKKRKKAAQRKLEATQNDLIRINDIIKEVERQVNSLKRQSQKGERFKNYKEELKGLEIKLAGLDLRKFLSLDQNLEGSQKNLEKNKKDLYRMMKEEELQLESLKTQLLEMEKELYSLQKEKEELSHKTYQLEREKSIASERETNLRELVTKSREQNENLKSRLVKINEEKITKRKSLQKFFEELKLKEKDNSDLESRLRIKEEEYQKAKEDYEEIRKNFDDLETNRNQIKMEIENLNLQLNEAEKDNSRYQKEIESISEKLNSTLKEIESQCLSLENDKKKIETQTEGKTALEEKLKSSESASEKSNLEKIKAESSLHSQKKHLGLLEEIIYVYRNHQQGKGSLLDQREDLPGIIDPLSNLLTVEEGYAKAIETLLGESLNFILCKDTESAQKTIEYMRENKKGGVTFLILDKFRGLKISRPELEGIDQETKWAIDVINCQKDIKSVLDFLLGKALIVPSFKDALKITSEANSDLTCVSLNGEVVREGKIISFGEKEGLFFQGKEKELDITRQNIQDLESRLERVKEEKDKKKKKKNEISEALLDKKQELKTLLEHYQEKELRSNQLKIEKDQMEKRFKEVQVQTEENSSKIHHLKLNQKEKNEKYLILEKEKGKINQKKQDSEKKLKKLDESKDKIYQELNELRIKIVTLQGKTEQLENDEKRLGELILEIESNIKTKEEEIKDWNNKIQEMVQREELVGKELKKVLELKESKNGIVDSKTYIKNDCTEKVNKIEEKLKEYREKKERFQEETHNLEMEKLKISNEIQKLKERIWEEYQEDITKLHPAEEFQESQVEEMRERRDFLKERIEKMGPVNLLAVDEYRSQKQRLDFLNEQYQDLTNAKESLTTAILTINKTARQLFLETFDKIRVNFQKVFSDLFEGGEADLWLEDERDPLESNIGISASPRGKKLLRLDQLSGGERALVAISLLFGIYLVKPSPFCILDEVDAPLDDANLLRFLRMIKKFSSHTQFIIITHNKLSMEASDVLYGVTMEKPGVSKIVSVRLEKEEEKSKELRVESRE
jgi:chromosome segregation protein